MTLTNGFVGIGAGCNPAQAPDPENSTAIGAFAHISASNQIALGDDQVEEIWAFGDAVLKANAATTNGFFGPAGNLTLSGNANIGVGFATLSALTTGSSNTAVGHRALESLTTGGGNVAIGDSAILGGVDTAGCTAVGVQAMSSNTTGAGNTAIGRFSLAGNVEAANNTAVGDSGLRFNTTGQENVAIGYRTAEGNLTGSRNVSIGQAACLLMQEGDENVAIGYSVLSTSTEAADSNVAIGFLSLHEIGSNSTSIGHGALIQASEVDNCAIGAEAGGSLTTGFSNVFLGFAAGLHANQAADASNSIAVGAAAFTTASNQAVLGNDEVTQTILRGDVGIGIGTTTPQGVLQTLSEESDSWLTELSDQMTDTSEPALIFVATKSGALGDGFGPSVAFQIRETGHPESAIGVVEAVRAGADDSGEIRLRPFTSGTLADGLAIRGQGASVAWDLAVPAGGDAGAGYSAATAEFGIYFGSGPPTLEAAQGSLYLRDDGSGINDRAYINTDGANGWTALITDS